jgi:hypothetical protein
VYKRIKIRDICEKGGKTREKQTKKEEDSGHEVTNCAKKGFTPRKNNFRIKNKQMKMKRTFLGYVCT